MFVKFLFIWDLKWLVGVSEFIQSVFRLNSKVTARDYDLCAKYSEWNRFIIKFIPSAFFAGGLAYSAPAYIHLALTGEFRPPYGMYFPGLDVDQWTHRVVLCVLNFFPIMVCIPILGAFDGFICIMFINMFMISNTITNDIDELGKLLADKTLSEKETKCKLTSIIRKHLDFNA